MIWHIGLVSPSIFSNPLLTVTGNYLYPQLYDQILASWPCVHCFLKPRALKFWWFQSRCWTLNLQLLEPDLKLHLSITSLIFSLIPLNFLLLSNSRRSCRYSCSISCCSFLLVFTCCCRLYYIPVPCLPEWTWAILTIRSQWTVPPSITSLMQAHLLGIEWTISIKQH